MHLENEELEEYKLSIVDEAEIMHLQKEKYETWDWVYGKNPDYNVTYVKKISKWSCHIKNTGGKCAY